MTIDVYILGTSHPLQCGAPKCAEESIRKFEIEIGEICSNFEIKRIAEEMSSDGLEHHEVTKTVCRRVANANDIPHEYVDLGREERSHFSLDDSVVINTVRRHSISNGGPFRKAFDDLVNAVRKRVWVARILSGNEWPVLFVCGSEHTVSIQELFGQLSINSKIAHCDYEP